MKPWGSRVDRFPPGERNENTLVWGHFRNVLVLCVLGVLAKLTAFYRFVLGKILYGARSDVYAELIVVFGSQTGTSEEFAYKFSENLKKLKVPHRVLDALQVDEKLLRRKITMVFFISTQGIGEPPDNIKHVFSMLHRSRFMRLPGRHAVFGIGDSSYTSYNEAAVNLSALLHSAGSTAWYPLELADTSYKLDGTFQKWMRALLRSHFSVDEDNAVDPADQTRQKHSQSGAFSVCEESNTPDKQSIVYVRMVSSELLTPSSSRTNRFIKFESLNKKWDYEPGDHVGCFPPNADDLIDGIIELLGISDLELEQPVSTYVPVDGTVVSPGCSVYLFLKWHADIHAHPKKKIAEQISQYIVDENERSTFQARMDEGMSSKDRSNWVQLLSRYSSLVLSLADFLRIIPQKLPRFYSICNFSPVEPLLSITVAAVEGGLCSQWLCSLEEGAEVPVFLRKSDFRISFQDLEKDVLFIGMGTGIAPFLGFLQKKHFWRNGRSRAEAKISKNPKKLDGKRGPKAKPCGAFTLIFGCRSSADWLFAQTIRNVQECTSFDDQYKSLYQHNQGRQNSVLPLEGHTDSFVLNAVHVAFSRESPFRHVQDCIDDISESIWKVIAGKGTVFICGDGLQMGYDVEQCLREKVVQRHGGHSCDEAAALIEEMKQSKCLRRDVWDA
ncbi:NADPH--cytochrome P450 reductase [Perkinsela sp. CCAP 1560/4]|nr:NADPH--cytochrome P450 reductase [Perkinsela sp. CCAP 1560/4]|eukprot:KNH06352.1 NADPH--cytochrome P450 reductase [Perkinsela sp. CCAP 1560/4]